MSIATATRIAGATLAVAAAALAAGTGSARATDITLPDFCATAPPHKTLNLGPAPQTATSNGAGYYYSPSVGCSRFIVDVNVPPSGGQPFSIAGSYAGPATGPDIGWWLNGVPLSQADCTLFRQYVTVYKKPWFTLSPPAKFTKLTSGVFKGKWVPAVVDPFFGSPAHCEMVLLSGQKPAGHYLTGANPLAGATYRMTLGVKTSDWQKVKVRAEILPPPPG